MHLGGLRGVCSWGLKKLRFTLDLFKFPLSVWNATWMRVA